MREYYDGNNYTFKSITVTGESLSYNANFNQI